MPVSATPVTPLRRQIPAIALVTVAHLIGLWALVHGLAKPPAEVVVKAELIAQVMLPPPQVRPPPTAPPPVARPQPPAPAKLPTQAPTPTPAPAAPAPTPAPAPPAPSPAPAPSPVTSPITAPSPNAATATPAVQAAAPSTATPPAPARPAPSDTAQPTAPAAPAKPTQPPTQASLIGNIDTNNRYPTASMRLGESGRNVVRIWVGPDGKPQKAEIETSSGFARLDQAAIQLAMAQRFKPATVNGVPTQTSLELPLLWKLPD
jgi:protein TonB